MSWEDFLQIVQIFPKSYSKAGLTNHTDCSEFAGQKMGICSEFLPAFIIA
jgi:hypothetical protein